MRHLTNDQTLRAWPRLARLLPAALLLTAAGASGCGDSRAAPNNTSTDISGTYVLADVGGNKLPTSIYQGPFPVNGQKIDARIDVVGSTLLLDATRYTLRIQFQVAAQGQTVPLSVIDSGTYNKTAEVLSFASADQRVGRLAGSIQSGDLKVSIDLVGDGYPPTYLFRK